MAPVGEMEKDPGMFVINVKDPIKGARMLLALASLWWAVGSYEDGYGSQ